MWVPIIFFKEERERGNNLKVTASSIKMNRTEDSFLNAPTTHPALEKDSI